MKQSLFANQEREARLEQHVGPLEKLDRYVDFKALAARIDAQMPRPSRARGGRRPMSTEMMVRILVLQQLYGIPDDRLELEIADRFSFRRFLSLQNAVWAPDAKTIWAFRDRLSRGGLSWVIFDSVRDQLAAYGFVAKSGQIIDASIVKAPVQHNSRAENEQVKAGEVPADWKESKRRQKDVDATWTKKHGKTYYGYKQTVNVDHRTKVIREVHVSTASEHDSLHFEKVLQTDVPGETVYADKGYASEPREAAVQARGLKPQIQHKTPKGQKQCRTEARRNTKIAKKRARVEHVFASQNQYGNGIVRSIGLVRARFTLELRAAVYNLRRLIYLIEQDARA